MVSLSGLVGPVFLSLCALAAVALAHPNSGLPPPKFDQQGHNHGSLYGMRKGSSQDNPILERNLRTDHTVEEIEAALAYHTKVTARFAASADEMAEPTHEDIDAMIEEEEGTLDGNATDAEMHALQYANADEDGPDQRYPFEIEGNSPPGARTVGEESVKQLSSTTP